MFCPQCGSTQSDELKYCKSCGSNLQALRQLMATREPGDSSTSSTRTRDRSRQRGMTPEEKRRREIKAGVITASAGVGIAIFLFALMGGIIASGRVSEAAAVILSRIWIVGIIPVLVGAALIFNGMKVSRRPNELSGESDESEFERRIASAPEAGYLPAADTNDLVAGSPFSVTDPTTRHLQEVPRTKDS